MDFYVMTLFCEMIQGAVSHSILKRAQEKGIINIHCVDIRDFSGNKHRRVDDYPYGGGVGMVMRAQPIYDAYRYIKESVSGDVRVIYMTPQGKKLTQRMAQDLSGEKKPLLILCGHYEGVDERIIEEIVTDEISIGDYVLTGGELPALVLIDAVARLIPGVLNKEESFQNETFTDNLLEYPQYTRPEEFLGKKVPEVLLSGHHKNVEDWRHEQSLARTMQKRPELMGEKEIKG